MSEQIIKILEYMGEKIGIAIDWTQKNVLPYAEDLARRFITYNIVEAALSIFAFVIVGIVSIGLFKFYQKCNLKAKKDEEDSFIVTWYSDGSTEPNVGGIFLFIAAGICALAAVIGIPIMISELIKWIIIPEFQIVEEVTYLLSGTA